jgi:hypothetical protein
MLQAFSFSFRESHSRKVNLRSRFVLKRAEVRFRGLLFNDGGTLRMDASQVNDGVSE